MKGNLDGPGLASTVIGGILIYAGMRGYSALAIAQNLITGRPIATGVVVNTPLKTSTPIASGTATDFSGPTLTGNAKAIGQQLAGRMGWTGAEWTALETLWTGESGWNPKAENPSSGAYGIPQALPYSKMPKAAWPEKHGGQSDAATQIQWGLTYIKGRYGSPSKALRAWQGRSPHWY